MKIRLFGSHECEKCVGIRASLDKEGVEYEFIGAMVFDDDRINQLCDDNNVSDLPHVQFLDDQEKVIDELVGDILPGHVLTKLETYRDGGPA